MAKKRICRGCNQPFIARKDAKTCSARCRKRLQRTKDLLLLQVAELEHNLQEAWNTPLPGQEYRPQLVTETAQEQEIAPIIDDEPETPPQPVQTTEGHRIFSWKRTKTVGTWMRALIFLPLLLFALSNSSHAQSLSQGYTTTDSSLKKGMIVSLSGDSSQNDPAVQSANVTDFAQVVGIAVGMNDSLVTLGSSKSRVYVASTGQAEAYVSDINGAVKKGDLLALSPLKGILMRTESDTGSIIGTAVEDFSEPTSQAVTVTDSSNKPVTVHVGLVNIDINIKPAGAGLSPQNWMQRLGKSITGKDVGELRVMAAMIVFVTLLVIEGTIIYSAVANTITSVGRNPLARKRILWQSVRSFGFAGLALMAGGAAISIILWL